MKLIRQARFVLGPRRFERALCDDTCCGSLLLIVDLLKLPHTSSLSLLPSYPHGPGTFRLEPLSVSPPQRPSGLKHRVPAPKESELAIYTMNIAGPPEAEWLQSSRMSESDGENDSLSDMEDAKPPVHPVPQMQGAFEESMMETLNESEDPELQDRMSNADSVSRRKMLLEQNEYQRTVAGRWKQRPGEQFHPLWKLVAQISFGMHLLQQGLAKSDEEVIKILQTHVDEIDGFLERTTEDFDLAQGDIDERIRYLRLPLEHGPVFDTMLNDRNFRIAIVEGNEKIEHIIDRTAAAMNDALKDVQKGLDATRELAKYLTRVDKQWDERSEEHDSVYLAMIGNTEGWTRAFLTLQSKGNALRRCLVQLGGIVAEMQRRAGAASRKNLVNFTHRSLGSAVD